MIYQVDSTYRIRRVKIGWGYYYYPEFRGWLGWRPIRWHPRMVSMGGSYIATSTSTTKKAAEYYEAFNAILDHRNTHLKRWWSY